MTVFNIELQHTSHKLSVVVLQVAKVSMSDIENGGECTYKIQRCVHFYACICVFASDEQLSKEFKYAIDADVSIGKDML